MKKKPRATLTVAGVSVPVSEDIYLEYTGMARRERYLYERDEDHGLVYYSDFDDAETTGEESIPDPAGASAEDEAIKNILIREMLSYVSSLSKADQKLIDLVYYQGMSLREAASELGVSHTTAIKRHSNLLAKLRAQMKVS